MRRISIVLLVVLGLVRCQSAPLENPSFRITKKEAEAAWRSMKKDPQPLGRPLVIVSGYLDPSMGAWWLSEQFGPLFDDDRVLDVGYASADDLDEARTMIIEAVDKAFPCEDPEWTVPVDVVGISMGGLAARYAAMPARAEPGARRLRIVRLFTLASPHRGAEAAELNLPHELLKQARTDSEFIGWLNEADVNRDYEILPYVRLGDDVIGVENAAPPGTSPWWLPNPAFEHAHIGGTLDVRFRADIARRLRGEPAYTEPPPAPLPEPEQPDA
jgi:pimeloyl-ACP methyl ester carboxylesterase